MCTIGEVETLPLIQPMKFKNPLKGPKFHWFFCVCKNIGFWYGAEKKMGNNDTTNKGMTQNIILNE